MIQRKRKAPNRVAHSYKDYESLIAGRAWEWAQKTGWEFDELMAEGNLVFVLACKDYIPGKAKFSTYLHKRLGWHYAVSFKRGRKHADGKSDIDTEQVANGGDQHARVAFITALYKHLDKVGRKGGANFDAHILIQLAMNTPADFVKYIKDSNDHCRVSRKQIQHYMVDTRS